MARQPRIDLRGIPQHVIQRGNDRQACFAAEAGYRRYLQELCEASSVPFVSGSVLPELLAPPQVDEGTCPAPLPGPSTGDTP